MYNYNCVFWIPSYSERERDRATERAEKAKRSQRDAISRLADMGLNSERIAEALNLSLAEVKAISNERVGIKPPFFGE